MTRRPFVTMAKPVGSFCNMSCSYCYYLHADNGQDFSLIRMRDDVLEKYISSVIEASDTEVVSFTWHGGEPTLAGIPFYEKAVELQKKYLRPSQTVWNNIQTNGLLIDENWCRFLKENRFDIGVSIDGTRFVHDTYRNDASGEDTYRRVCSSIELLKKHGIMPDLLCTVTSDTAANGRAVYTALRSFSTGWIQFIPIVRRDAQGNVTEDSVMPQRYGKFLKDVFREWVTHDLGKLNVQIFAETALILSGKPANVCWLSEECGNVLVVERDGSVFSCDHFVDHDHYIGNLTETDLSSLAYGERQTEFGRNKKALLSKECRNCEWLKICSGGCPKDRFARSSDGEEGHYWLCGGMKSYLSAAVPVLQECMRLSAQGRKPNEIMTAVSRMKQMK